MNKIIIHRMITTFIDNNLVLKSYYFSIKVIFYITNHQKECGEIALYGHWQSPNETEMHVHHARDNYRNNLVEFIKKKNML